MREQRHDGRANRQDRRNISIAAGSLEMLARFELIQRRRMLSDGTISSRYRILRLFAEHISPRCMLQAGREDVETFLDARDLGSRARYTYTSNISRFYEAMIDDGRTQTNPAARIDRPRQRAGIPRPISDEDLSLALRRATPQMALMLALGAYEGLRAKEIAGLRREDILETNEPPKLYVIEGKGGKDRVVPLHQDVMPLARAAGLRSGGEVIRRPDGRPVPSYWVSHQINGYLHGLGIDATCHQLRHWFGTKTYQATRDLRLVGEMMGHSSPNSTAIYARAAMDGAHDVVNALSAG